MYDNLCKYLIETYPDDFAAWLLGKPVALTQLEPTELVAEPIRMDSLLWQGEEMVLHVEFQTDPDPTMPRRMADYFLRLTKKFPQQQIRQVVIYLRQTGSELVQETAFQLQGMSHRYEVIRLWEQPFELFLNSPGLLPFAILGNTAGRQEQVLLERVRDQLQTISNVGLRGNLEMATAVLAGLKLELAVIKRIMRSQAMRESVFYQDIVQESLERGRREGRQEGEQIGIQKGEQIGIQKGEQRGIRKGYIKLLRQFVPLFEGMGVPMEPWLKRLGVARSELDED